MVLSSILRSPARRRRWLLAVSLALVLYALLGFLVAPRVARPYLTRTLSGVLHREVSLQRLRLNPFALSATADGFLVKDTDGAPFLSWDRLYVNFQILSLFHPEWTFRQIQLVNFSGRLVMRRDGTLNVSDIIASLSQAPATPEPAPEPLLLRVGRLRIQDARLDYRDLSRPAEFRTVLGPLRLDLRDFGTHQDSKNPYSFSGKTESGETFSWKGHFYLDPIRSGGELTLGNILLAKYHPYYGDMVAFDVQGGTADFASAYEFEWGPQHRIARLSGASLKLAGLKISERGLEELAVDAPSFEVSGADVDALSGETRIALLATKGGSLILRQYPDGSNNLRRMIEPLLVGEGVPPPAAGAAPTESPAGSDPTPPAGAAPPATASETKISIAEVRIDDYAVVAEDLVPPRPVRVHLDQVGMLMRNVDNRPETTSNGSLTFRWEEGGTVSLDGELSILKLQGNLKARIDRIDITPLDPYLEPTADLRVTSGKLSVEGVVKVSLLDPEHPSLSYVGGILLEDFVSVDAAKQGEFLKCRRLEISPLDYSLDPPHMRIGEVTAQDAVIRLAIDPDGSINAFTVLRMAQPAAPGAAEVPAPTPPAPPAPAPAADSGETTIKRVRLRNGRLLYEDRSLQPAVSLSLSRVNGTVSGLSSKELARADVDVQARLDDVAPVKLFGKINPLIEDRFSDLTLEARGADLMPMAPYSAKYLGYGLQKGKLDLAMKYLLSSRSLQANNLITIDQLTLGDKVESPDATSLPVKLGVALLKDRQGVIELDVPVEGSLDDPEFRLGRVIVRAIGVVFAKLVTSPFKLLANAFGGSEEDLSTLEFDPGGDALTPAAQEKLNVLVTSLYERPALTLAIHGSVDEGTDREGLKRKKLEELLRQEKWNSLSKKQRAATTLEATTVAEAEVPDLLKSIFKTAWSKGIAALLPGAPEPAAAAAPPQEAVKPETPEAMEEWLLARLEVTSDDLRRLAARRAAGVRDYILSTEKVEPGRLFLSEETPAEGAAGSRVTMTLE